MKIHGDGSLKRLDRDKNGKLKEPKNCRKWVLRVSTDCGTKDKRFNGTHSQAKKALEQFKAELLTDVMHIKFSDYADKWYERRERKGTIAQSTLKKDRNILKILKRKFRETELNDFNHGQLVDGLLEIKTENNYSDHYYADIFITMKALLISAKKDGYILKNVLEHENAPKVSKTARQALSLDEFQNFKLRLSVEPLKPHIIAVYIALLTGSRRGEICGFTWEDVDFNSKVMFVRRSMQENGKPKNPKSTAGFRAYPIMGELHDILKSWQVVQEHALLRIGVKQTLNTPIVNNDLGKFMNPLNLDRWWREHRDYFGVTGLVLHELRHTYMTLLANSGAPSKVIQGIAGWSTLAMADTYVHEDMTAKMKAVDNLEKFLEFGGDN